MEPIRVTIPMPSPEFAPLNHYEAAGAVAAAIASAGPGHGVEIRQPQGANDINWLEFARTIFVTVPWDNIAAMGGIGVFLARWLTKQVRMIKEHASKEKDRAASRPEYFFPEGASQAEREELLRTTPYWIRIYGRGVETNLGLLLTIEIDETMEEAVIKQPEEYG
jgi:hypothetical protein